MTRRAPTVLLALVAVLLVACGTGETSAEPTTPPTLPNVGNLPDPLAVYASTTTTERDDEPAEPTVETTVEGDADEVGEDGEDGEGNEDGVGADVGGGSLVETEDTIVETEDTRFATEDTTEVPPVGDLADGPRLLVIGDSISEGSSGELCRQLVAEGWQVALDAENGRSITAGQEILDQRLDEDEWDAVVIHLGSNYDGDPETYGEILRQMLNRLRPRPVLLITVSEAEENRSEVNFVLREASRRYENVRLVDWAERTKDDASLTAADDLHLSESGQQLLTSLIAEALGAAPGGDDGGACLDLDDL